MSKILLTVNGSTFGVTLQQAQEMFTRLETEIPRLRRERAGMIRDEIKDLQRELEALGLDGIPPQVSVPEVITPFSPDFSELAMPATGEVLPCHVIRSKYYRHCETCGLEWTAKSGAPPCPKASPEPTQPPHPMPDLIGCEALQYSDQMVCKRCNHTWDVNDTYPPACKGILKSAK